jgi:hypothetical protein
VFQRTKREPPLIPFQHWHRGIDFASKLSPDRSPPHGVTPRSTTLRASSIAVHPTPKKPAWTPASGRKIPTSQRIQRQDKGPSALLTPSTRLVPPRDNSSSRRCLLVSPLLRTGTLRNNQQRRRSGHPAGVSFFRKDFPTHRQLRVLPSIFNCCSTRWCPRGVFRLRERSSSDLFAAC